MLFRDGSWYQKLKITVFSRMERLKKKYLFMTIYAVTIYCIPLACNTTYRTRLDSKLNLIAWNISGRVHFQEIHLMYSTLKTFKATWTQWASLRKTSFIGCHARKNQHIIHGRPIPLSIVGHGKKLIPFIVTYIRPILDTYRKF